MYYVTGNVIYVIYDAKHANVPRYYIYYKLINLFPYVIYVIYLRISAQRTSVYAI